MLGEMVEKEKLLQPEPHVLASALKAEEGSKSYDYDSLMQCNLR